MSTAKVQAKAEVKPITVSPLDRLLRVLSSVRLGIILLSLLIIACFIGMLIMQVNVDGFRDYYLRLSPAERTIYGKLGFFDIYNAWYFNLLLALTGLNIVLASIDRFPAAWSYISKPRLIATPKFIQSQHFKETVTLDRTEDLAERVAAAWRSFRFRVKISQGEGYTTVFAQRGAWNRLMAYVVHVALLTIFIGGFLTNRYGQEGRLEMSPGIESSKLKSFTLRLNNTLNDLEVSEAERELPFTVLCTDIQQKLINPDGNLQANNTLDWLTEVIIKDGGTEKKALVHLNNPVDYKGFRFFQSSFSPVGSARTATIGLIPESGGEPKSITLRLGEEKSIDGVRINLFAFFSDFDVRSMQPLQASEYQSPVAILKITTPDGKVETIPALRGERAERMMQALPAVAGYKFTLKDFEKVSMQHTLQVQYDPGRLPFYYGSALLCVALFLVFFASHQRVWAVIEEAGDGKVKLHIGGNVNRNRAAFEKRFRDLVDAIVPARQSSEVK